MTINKRSWHIVFVFHSRGLWHYDCNDATTNWDLHCETRQMLCRNMNSKVIFISLYIYVYIWFYSRSYWLKHYTYFAHFFTTDGRYGSYEIILLSIWTPFWMAPLYLWNCCETDIISYEFYMKFMWKQRPSYEIHELCNDFVDRLYKIPSHQKKKHEVRISFTWNSYDVWFLFLWGPICMTKKRNFIYASCEIHMNGNIADIQPISYELYMKSVQILFKFHTNFIWTCAIYFIRISLKFHTKFIW